MAISYKKISHIIDRQYEAEQAFLKNFQDGDYTINNPLIAVNPYIYCPLTALVAFSTPIATEVKVIVHGKEKPETYLMFFRLKRSIFCLYMVYMPIMLTKYLSFAPAERKI